MSTFLELEIQKNLPETIDYSTNKHKIVFLEGGDYLIIFNNLSTKFDIVLVTNHEIITEYKMLSRDRSLDQLW